MTKAVLECMLILKRTLLVEEKLTAYRLRTDVNEYEVVLWDVMRLFGEGIRESLTRMMGNFLSSTGCALTNSKLMDWEKGRALVLKCHNSDTERPFAVMKWLAKLSFNGPFKPQFYCPFYSQRDI